MNDIKEARKIALNLHYEKALGKIGTQIGLDPFIETVVITGYSKKLNNYLLDRFVADGYDAKIGYTQDNELTLVIKLPPIE